MAKKTKKSPAPHCKRVDNGKGGKRKMCFLNGKIASEAKVKAARARSK